MKFSLKDQLDGLELDLTETRQAAFQMAVDSKVQKRDILWLKRLKYEQDCGEIEIPEGWEVMESDIEETPAYKNEKSVFYWLQHALYHVAIEMVVGAGEVVTIELPQFASNVWPLLNIKIGDGAKVTIVDDHGFEMTDKTPFRSVIVSVGKESEVRWNGYQHHDDSVVSFDQKRIVLGKDSRFDFYHHVMGGSQSFEESVIEMKGDRSRVFSQTVFFGHQMQQQEMRMNHLHVGKETVSNMISKGAVTDTAHSGFLGYIQMEHGCDDADANLEEHNLLLSNTSKIDAIPGLEIGYHNVAAAHAAYMERVDDERLFYLASRGIPKEEAIQLIIEGFFLDAIQGMKNESMEERVFENILNRLH
jgi:Fe-S cluster assembly protein SufD